MTATRIAPLAALALFLGMSVSAMAAQPGGTYIRKGEQEVKVFVKDGRLYCRRVSDGYEMCNGMQRAEDGSWQGSRMKHPDMPSFMSFNGTVRFAKDSLEIQGCALGMCDSETWRRKK